MAITVTIPYSVAQVGIPITIQLSASGGVAPYTYNVTGGSLPPGLSLLSASGIISGTVSSAAQTTYIVTVTATDSTSASGSGTGYIYTQAQALVFSCGNLPGGIQGIGYSGAMSFGGGVPPYTLSIISGALPTGLSLNASTGAITGTPTVVATSTFDVQLTDSNAPPTSRTVTCSIVVQAPSGLPLAATCIYLPFEPAGYVGLSYSTQWSAYGGNPPYTFAVIAGALPPGLSVSSSGAVTGTPTTTGLFNFTKKVTDASSNTSTTQCGIQVFPNPAGPLRLIWIDPFGGGFGPSCLNPGALTKVIYTNGFGILGGKPPYGTVTLASGSLPAGLNLDAAGVVTGWITASPGTYPFTVQTTDAAGTTAQLTVNFIVNPCYGSPGGGGPGPGPGGGGGGGGGPTAGVKSAGQATPPRGKRLPRQYPDLTQTTPPTSLATQSAVRRAYQQVYDLRDAQPNPPVFNITPDGLVPGSIFTLPSPPNPPTSLQLFRNGVLQQDSVNFTLTGTQITMTVPLVAGEWLRASFLS